MVTMIRTLFRHIGESLKSLKRNGWMTLASVSAVTVTLVLVGVFLSVILNVQKLAKDVESAVDISVFVEIGTEEPEIKALEKELEGLKNVEKVTFSSREEQYKKLVDDFGDTWKLFNEDENPLYDVYIVSTTEPEFVKEVQKKVEKLPNVSRADYGSVSSDKIFQIAKAINKWGWVGTGLLLFVAVFLISNTIRITIISRKREIQIMRLVGAKNGFIRWPFFLEGAWIGILGSIVPVVIMVFGYIQFSTIAKSNILSTGYELIPANELVTQVSGLMLLIGVFIGSLGSVLSMRRFLKI